MKPFTRSVARPQAMSPNTLWNSSDSAALASSMHTRLFSRSIRKSKALWTDVKQMKGGLVVAGGSCLKSPVYCAMICAIRETYEHAAFVFSRAKTEHHTRVPTNHVC